MCVNRMLERQVTTYFTNSFFGSILLIFTLLLGLMTSQL